MYVDLIPQEQRVLEEYWVAKMKEAADKQDYTEASLCQFMAKKYDCSIPVGEKEIPIFALTTRASNCLKAEGIRTIEKLASMTERELSRIPNLGPKSCREIKEFLRSEGKSLKS